MSKTPKIKIFSKRKIAYFLLFSIIFTLISIISFDYWVSYKTKNQTFDSVSEIPYNEVGLLLGTSKYLKHGSENSYYSHRITAAFELYKNKKIKFILISGDNGNVSYNEPQMMKEDLIALGIPANKIFLDYAGFRTLDSVIRANKVFMLSKMTVISQKFHNERAIYIANEYDLKMIGFNAKDVSQSFGFKVKLREKFARINMLLDLLFGKDPKFLGEQIAIK
ncbi:MAG: ElyC/SanA/YdcF family protein [Bacteroidota bacterium]